MTVNFTDWVAICETKARYCRRKTGYSGHTGYGHYHERYVRCSDGKWRIARSKLSYLQMDMHRLK